MQNYNKAVEYSETASNSSGTAMQKMATYEESVEAKTKKLQAAFEAFSNSILNSGVIKGVIDLGTGLLTLLNTIGPVNTALVTATALFIAFRNSMAVTAIASFSASIGEAIPFLGSLTNGLIAATGASGALATAMNLIPLVAIITAITAVGFGISKLVTTTEELQQAAKTAQSNYQSILQQIDETNSKISTTSQQIDELQSKGTLTFVEQDQLQKLEDTNSQLQTSVELLTKEKDISARQSAESSEELYNRKYSKYDFSYSAVSEYISSASSTGNNAILVSDKNDVSALIAAYSKLNELKEQSASLDDKENYNNMLTDLESSLTSTRSSLQSIYDSISALSDPSEKDLEILNNVKSGLDLIDSTLNSGNWKTNNFNSVFDGDFSNAKDELSALATSGKLDQSVIQSVIDSYDGLSNALSNVGLSVDDVIAQFKALSFNSDFDKINDEVDRFTGYIKTAQDAVSAMKSTMDDYSDAMDKAASGEELSGQQIVELLTKYPDLQSAVVETANGYKLEEGAVRAALNAKIAQNKADIEDSITAAKKVLEAEGIKLAGINGTTDGIKNQIQAKKAQLIAEYTELGIGGQGYATSAEAAEVDKLNQLLSIIQTGEANLANVQNLEKYYNNVDKYTGASIKAASAAEKAQKSTEELAKDQEEAYKNAFENEYKTLQYYHEIGYYSDEEYYNKLSDLNDKYFKGNAEYLDEYRQYYLEVQNGLKQAEEDKIKTEFDSLKHEEAMGRISEDEYYQDLLDMANQYYAGKEEYLSEYQQIEEEYYNWEKQQQEDTINRVKEQNSTVESAFDKVKSAIDGVVDKQTKAIDAQKTANETARNAEMQSIQDQIDALDKENDAQDRANNLEEAAQKLANAKSQRTNLIYREGTGFTYQADQDAVESAQKDYDTAVYNDRKAALQGQKDDIQKQLDSENDAFDKQITAWNDYKQQFDDVISDYEQAQNQYLAQQIFGAQFLTEVLGKSTELLENFHSRYDTIMNQITSENLDNQMTDEEIAHQILMLIQQNTESKIRQQYYDNQNAGTPHYANGGVDTTGGPAILDGQNTSAEVIFNGEQARTIYDLFSDYGTNQIAKNLGTAIANDLPNFVGTNSSSNINYDQSLHIDNVEVRADDTQQFLNSLKRIRQDVDQKIKTK